MGKATCLRVHGELVVELGAEPVPYTTSPPFFLGILATRGWEEAQMCLLQKNKIKYNNGANHYGR